MSRPSALALALLALCSLAQAQDDSEQVSCRVHVVNNTASSDDNMLGHVRSSLKVLSAADIMDVSVILQVQHPDVAALQVTLTAAGTSKNSSTITLKAPAAGTGGANMIQTIFSDYAPSLFPNGPAEAPFSSVYRPAQPLSTLVAGDSTAAGAGGSQGVWTLTVTDTAATKRPLKLTGWELWLCGASNGPLFASDMNTTAFDGSEVLPELSIVRKRVAIPSKSDVAAAIKSAKRVALAEDDPVSEIIDEINGFIADKLARVFEPVEALLDRVTPDLSHVLEGHIASSIKTLKGLPLIMGFVEKADGLFHLPTSEEEIKDFLDTLVHCYNDLYWCWEKTGIDGHFAQDFVATWEGRAKPVATKWAAVQDKWLTSITNFEENNPVLAPWGDALFYSTISTLYAAAHLDAVATVAETWADTAIKLALYISPVRFSVKPEALVYKTMTTAASAVKTIFTTLDMLTDTDNTNDVEAVTQFTTALVSATRELVDLLTKGVSTQTESMQKQLAASAGGLAAKAGSMNDAMAKTLGAIDPRLGAIFNASSDATVNEMMRQISTSGQDAVERYFQASNNKLNMGGEFDRMFNLAGEAVIEMSTNIATALKSAQTTLDEMLPGPSMQQVIVDLRSVIEAILSDSRDLLDKVIPIPEIQEMVQVVTGSLLVQLDLLKEAAAAVKDGPGAQAIIEQLNRIIVNLLNAKEGVSGVVSSIKENVPGPLVKSTLEGIRQQSARTVLSIERMFAELAAKYPSLDPAVFITDLGDILEGLILNTFDLTSAFENVAPAHAAKELGQALPSAVKPVVDTVSAAAAGLPKLAGSQDPQKLKLLQEGIGKNLETFTGHVQTIADGLPNQPPVPAIAERLSQRTSALSQDSSRLSKALQDAAGVPGEVADAGIADLNDALAKYIDDLRGQNAQAAQLGALLTQGPIAVVAAGLSHILYPVTHGLEVLTAALPTFPEVRALVKNAITPAADAFGTHIEKASKAAVEATANINKAGLDVFALTLEALVGSINKAQLQVANILSATTNIAEQLLATAPTVDVTSPLANIDEGLATTIGSISNEFLQTVEAFGAPDGLLKALIEPLAAKLNLGLTAVLNGAKAVAGVDKKPNLDDMMQGATGVVSDLAGEAARALGLPATTVRTNGRHLLAAADNSTEVMAFSIPDGFDVLGFHGAIKDALLSAASHFANSAVAAVNGRPGLSAALGAIQHYIETLKSVSEKLDGFLAGLPHGKVASVILDAVGGKTVIDSLASLQGTLKSAAPGEQGAVVDQIAQVLSSLASGGSSGTSPVVQAAVRAASKQLLPNAEELLNGFRSQLVAALASTGN